MMLDYLIVGSGLAGISFAKQLIDNGNTFKILASDKTSSSKVAGGMYNPVILKRFTPVWDIEDQYKHFEDYYNELEKLLETKINYPIDIKRLFTSIEEQNTWFAKCDHPVLSNFMSTELDKTNYSGIDSPFAYGNVINGGWVDTAKLITSFEAFLKQEEKLIRASFKHSLLKIENGFIEYDNIKAKRIVFCEGIGLKNNPFFNYLPMKEAKGELLIIKSEALDIDFILKSSVFILPLGNSLFKVGATFNWNDKTEMPTEAGKEELIQKLKAVIDVPFEVVDQLAGIRPTVKDRRPLVGIHPNYKQLCILNGLGTRGVLIGPKYAKELYNHIEFDHQINPEADINRYTELYQG